MRADIDHILLDRLFQPLADRAAGWISCFGLARLSLGTAVALQFVVLASDLHSSADLMHRLASSFVTLLALVGAGQASALIARTERQARAGGMNVRRITLRLQRLAWVVVTPWAVISGSLQCDLAGWGLCGASVAWLALIYLVSCTPMPPPARAGQRLAWA